VSSPSAFQPLSAAEGGPSNVIRHSGTVLRPAQPWTGTVHALLRHLEDVGYPGSPRVLGGGVDDRGNEVLTFIEGVIEHPRTWSDEAIWLAGGLLRDLHAATASFRPPPDAAWQPWWMHHDGPGAVIGHCDAGPWHTVVHEGRPVAFIDWTLAGPVDPLDEVAVCAWWHAQLHGDDVAERNNLPDASSRALHLRLFLDGYGLPVAGRDGLVDRMIDLAIRDCAAEATQARITPESDDPAPLWSLAWRARAAAWMIEHRTMLERATRA
jgi:hypothetical protein